jgi:hypothetical protein
MSKLNTKRTLLTLVAGVASIALILTACTASPPQPEPESPVAEAPGEVQRVTLEDSKTAFDSGEAVFLDVRSESSYMASHIPGAVFIPLPELEGRIGELDPNQWIITYCT